MTFFITIIVSVLIAASTAIPAPQNLLNIALESLGLDGLVGSGTPPLATTVHSPECADLNNGTYVCCETTFNGGMPLIKELSELTDYPLTANAINGLIACKQLSANEECSPGTKLCCGSIALMPAIAMYCQQALY